MTSRLYVFISSRMQELAPERKLVQELLHRLSTDLVELRPWIFETDAPASNEPIRQVYLNALKQSALYIGLFWNDYGEWTIDEFDQATQWGIDRHIYVKNVEAEKRDVRLTDFLEQQSNVMSGITPKWFTSVDELGEQISKSIRIWMQDRLAWHAGDSSATFAEHEDDITEQPPRFIGRSALIENVHDLLDDNERVLLQGFGGTGKTALAATIAAQRIREGKGSVLWLRAGSENVETLAAALARPFNAHLTVTNASGGDMLKALRTVLNESHARLLVLDDVWNGATLSDLLKAVPRQMGVLATARQRYALDEILEVGILTPDEALDLLGYYARRDFKTDDGARELCRQVGFHAFALEVAGKTLKVDRIAPSELLQRISAAPHVLRMPENFAEEGRTSIVELLDASLNALDESARKVFLAFGALFVPSATSELLAAYMGIEERAVREALTTLQRRGLADQEAGNQREYGIHDLAYSYARTVHAERHADQSSVVDAVKQYAAAHENDVEALDAEWGNLVGAADAAQKSGGLAALVEIASTLIGAYLSARGHNPLFLKLLDDAIDAAEILGTEYDQARHFFLSKRANVFYDRGELDNAFDYYQEALELARSMAMQDREVILLSVIGKVLSDKSEDATPYLDAADKLARTLDDDFLLGFVLEQRGYHAQCTNDYEAARRIFAEEAVIAERLGDDDTLFFALLNAGSAERLSGEVEMARNQHQRALAIARRMNNRVWMAHALQSLGEDFQDLGDSQQAKDSLKQALALFRESGMRAKAKEIEMFMKAHPPIS